MSRRSVLCIILCIAVITCMTACSGGNAKTEKTDGEKTNAAHSNKADFEYIHPEGTTSDINQYYNDLGVECNVNIRSTGGDVKWGGAKVSLPVPSEPYTIGFSVYYTVDEVGAMYLEGMKEAAKEAGIELLVNDADYDQDAQNQAIEQWILQGVDGVILTPCDFYGVQDALDSLEQAHIPVVTIDAPPNAGNIDSAIMYDCVEQGRMAGELLEKALLDKGSKMEGVIYYGTLPFIHPNAVTRELGFKEVFQKYDKIAIKALTGESPEEHYTAFEGALQADPDMLGAWGLYSSATYGMMNAIKASGKEILLTSIDNDRVILEGIYNGEVLGSACYSAIEGSRLGMMQMINLLDGVNVPGIVYQTNTMVTDENVGQMFEEYYNGATLADFMAGK